MVGGGHTDHRVEGLLKCLKTIIRVKYHLIRNFFRLPTRGAGALSKYDDEGECTALSIEANYIQQAA